MTQLIIEGKWIHVGGLRLDSRQLRNSQLIAVLRFAWLPQQLLRQLATIVLMTLRA